MSDLIDSIGQALGEHADAYDIDAITDALRAAGCDTADDISSEEFWEIVEAHTLPDEPEPPTPAERFQQEMTAALQAERPVGVPAVWRRGGVTLRVEGASRVRHTWPQQLAIVHISTTDGTQRTVAGVNVQSWDALWDMVSPLVDAWAEAVTTRRLEYEQAQRAAEKAQKAAREAVAAARRAEEALNALLPEDEQASATMTPAQVADYLGIAPASVRKTMSRWGIEAVYERGASGRPEARYPSAEVQAAASQRPGRGARTDLR